MITAFQDKNFIFATLKEFQKLSRSCEDISLHIENVGSKSWMNFSALLPSSPQKKEESLFNSATEFFGRWSTGSDSRLRFVHHGDQTWLHFSTTLGKPAGPSETPQTFQHSRIFTRTPCASSTVKKAKSPRKRERDNERAAAHNARRKLFSREGVTSES